MKVGDDSLDHVLAALSHLGQSADAKDMFWAIFRGISPDGGEEIHDVAWWLCEGEVLPGLMFIEYKDGRPHAAGFQCGANSPTRQ